jgi:hypothetical protein
MRGAEGLKRIETGSQAGSPETGYTEDERHL